MSDQENQSRKLEALRSFAERIDTMPIEEFTKRLDNTKMSCEPSQYARLERYIMGYDPEDHYDEALEVRNKELEEENARLRRACSVLYHGVDEDLQRLAENEYSGCASTQRDNVHELRKVLVGK